MKFQLKVAIFTIIALCSLVSLVTSDELDCERGCRNTCGQKSDPQVIGLISTLIQYLEKLLTNELCERDCCNEKPFQYEIEIYPAKDFDITLPEYKPLTLGLNRNCCYELSGIYDNTLSGIKPNGACVKLFDGAGCSGAFVTIQPDICECCLKWIDCNIRLSEPGALCFNDRASSVQLC